MLYDITFKYYICTDGIDVCNDVLDISNNGLDLTLDFKVVFKFWKVQAF